LLSELRSSDIGISASLYEGFGFPLIEMISCGLPVIVSERGSLPELMGEAGLSFNPDDANDLCNKIINMVNDVQLREDFIQKSIQRRGDFFGWDEYAMKLTKLYQKITNGHI
jgi:glycosyltransferase involved in cell wall biosynthesis